MPFSKDKFGIERCKRGHVIHSKNIYKVKGQRICRACRLMSARKYDKTKRKKRKIKKYRPHSVPKDKMICPCGAILISLTTKKCDCGMDILDGRVD